MPDKYDALILGSGIGGCAIGALLSHQGYRIKLFEKNGIIGGRCTTFEDRGCRIDLGVHLFGVGENGSLGEVCRLIDMPNAIRWIIARDPRPILNYCGDRRVYSVETMIDLIEKNETERQIIKKFWADCITMPKEKIKKLYYNSLADFIRNYSENQNLFILVTQICLQYFCVSPFEASAGEFIRCFQEVVRAKSSAYPLGGCISIPAAYAKAIKTNGSEVQLNTKITKIIVAEGHVKGVEMKGGGLLESNIVISNADIKNTALNLVGEKYFPPDYIQKIKNLKYATKFISVKVTLDKKVTDHKLIMYIPTTFKEALAFYPWTKRDPPEKIGGMITSPTNFDPSLAPKEKQMIFFACFWDNSGPPLSKKEEERWGEVLLESLKDCLPEIKAHIEWYRTDTSNLANKYAGEEGNIIGIGQTTDQIAERRPSHLTPIPGLYIVGAEAGGHGIGTELAASSALELSDILSKKSLKPIKTLNI